MEKHTLGYVKVHHFAGGCSGVEDKKQVAVDVEVVNAWAQVYVPRVPYRATIRKTLKKRLQRIEREKTLIFCLFQFFVKILGQAKQK